MHMYPCTTRPDLTLQSPPLLRRLVGTSALPLGVVGGARAGAGAVALPLAEAGCADEACATGAADEMYETEDADVGCAAALALTVGLRTLARRSTLLTTLSGERTLGCLSPGTRTLLF